MFETILHRCHIYSILKLTSNKSTCIFRHLHKHIVTLNITFTCGTWLYKYAIHFLCNTLMLNQYTCFGYQL